MLGHGLYDPTDGRVDHLDVDGRACEQECTVEGAVRERDGVGAVDVGDDGVGGCVDALDRAGAGTGLNGDPHDTGFVEGGGRDR